MRNLIVAAACLAGCMACGNGKTAPSSLEANGADSIIVEDTTALGDWTKPINGMDGEEGISIMAGGKTASINRSTLVYKAWKQSGDTLFVSGESIGNGTAMEMTDTLLLQGDSLAQLTAGNVVFKYGRKK